MVLGLPFVKNVGSLYEWNILKWDEKQQTINQSIKSGFQYFSTLIIDLLS